MSIPEVFSNPCCGKLRSCHVEGSLPCQVHLASVANRGFRMFQGYNFCHFPGVAPVCRSRTSVPPSRLHESNDSSAPRIGGSFECKTGPGSRNEGDSPTGIGHLIGLRGCNIHHSIIHSSSSSRECINLFYIVPYIFIYLSILTFLHSHCQAHVHVHAMQHSTGVVLDGIVFPRCGHGSFTSTGQ